MTSSPEQGRWPQAQSPVCCDREAHRTCLSLGQADAKKSSTLSQIPSSSGLPCDSDSEESTCIAGDLGLTPRLGRSPGEGNGNPLHIFAWRIHGQRNLGGYIPWGRKELDTTEQLTILRSRK